MKIGIDARLWNETGVGRYIRNLVKHLQVFDRENEYVLFARSEDESRIMNYVASIKTAKKLKVVKADIRWHSFTEQWEMPKILAKENLDLVHFPYFNVPIFYRGPFVVTIHDLIINHFPTGRATTLPWPLYQVKRLGYKMSLSHAVRSSRKIIAVSEATKGEIIDHFGVDSDKIVVIYESGELSINLNHKLETRLSDGQVIDHKYKLNKSYLLYVGNAHPHKNLERLLEAWKESHQPSAISHQLVLVGKEDYFYERLKKRVEEMGLNERVVFYGEASDSELQKLYKNATALILPSLMEGFGLPALEAMGQGCLVLASDIPAFREVCGDAAIYFNPVDVDDITGKIKQVCYHDLNHDNKIKEGLVVKGQKRVKMFSWQKMARETLDVYGEAAVCL